MEKQQADYLIDELIRELGAKQDGGNKNLIARCPFCGKDGKFGIYIGKETTRKKPLASHCFSCGFSARSIDKLLECIGRDDLKVTPTICLEAKLESNLLFPLEENEDIDDSLCVVPLPDLASRIYTHPYLKGRGFCFEDYEYFPVYTTRRLNRRFADYVVFPVIDCGDVVAYVARHLWEKGMIDEHNRKAARTGDYKIRRFNNSTENSFSKLLYNYDAVVENVTDTVILTEGIFDVVALTRKLDLYDNTEIAPVATFGKKISQVQVYKLQCKNVRTVVIGYDGDAVEAIKKTAGELAPYFDVFIADIPEEDKDWQDLTNGDIFDIFSGRLRTPVEYKLLKL